MSEDDTILPGGGDATAHPEITALEDQVMERAAELRRMLQGPPAGQPEPEESDLPGVPDPTEDVPEPEAAEADAVASAADTPLPAPSGVTPRDIRAATTQLVSMQLLGAPSDVLTGKVIAALQVAMDRTDPGLYDLANPSDIKESIHVLSGRRSGGFKLPVEPKRSPRAGL